MLPGTLADNQQCTRARTYSVHINPELVPASVWKKLILLLYRAKWRLYPALRLFGLSSRMGWGEIDVATRALVAKISPWNPEVVVGVGVGGAIFGAILAGNLDDCPLIVTDRHVTWAANRRESRLMDSDVGEERTRLLHSKRVLLVHAEIVSGKTTERAIEYLCKFTLKESVRIACTDFNEASSVRPDYWYMRTQSIIQKPWRITQTYRNPDDGRRA